MKLSLPLREKLDFWKDRSFRVSEPEAEDSSGNRLQVTSKTWPEGSSKEAVSYTVEFPSGKKGIQTFTVRWTVEGAVRVNGDTAMFIWPASTHPRGSLPTTETLTWHLPGPVGDVTCSEAGGENAGPCDALPELTIDGESVTSSWEGARPGIRGIWTAIEFPASAVSGVEEHTAFSGDLKRWIGWALVFAALAAVISGALALGRWLGRMNLGSRDQRYADVPPGVFGGTEVTRQRRRGQIPVRFSPPEAPVALVGYTMRGKYDGSQVAATLTHMAVNGAIQLQAKPFSYHQLDASKIDTQLEQVLFTHAAPPGTRLGSSGKSRLVFAGEADFALAEKDRNLFGDNKTTLATTLVRLAVLGLGAAVAVGGWQMVHPLVAIPGFALGFLVLFGMMSGLSQRRPPLMPDGTVLREQAEGFRHYLRTAEAHQLNFEAERDIYREYLPWAVLFGEVRRGTKVCQKLASAGRIAPPNTSFMLDATSLNSVARGLSSIQSSVQPASTSTSGGSGSSSGFSGSSSGGSGGGGTSASSW